MLLRRHLRRTRPGAFTLDPNDSLSWGLKLGLLGMGAGTLTAFDSSLCRNHGTLTNMDPATDWVFDPALRRWVWDFDGGNQYIPIVNSIPNFAGDLSISYWFMKRGTGWVGAFSPAVDGATGPIPSYFWWYAGPGQEKLFWTTSYTGWHHVCFVRTGDSGTVYRDGVPIGSQTIGTNDLSGSWEIGRGDCFYYWNGLLGDALLHSRALLPAEIARLADRSDPTYGGWIRTLGRRVFPAAVAGGVTFKPAWARRCNTLLGAGV